MLRVVCTAAGLAICVAATGAIAQSDLSRWMANCRQKGTFGVQNIEGRATQGFQCYDEPAYTLIGALTVLKNRTRSRSFYFPPAVKCEDDKPACVIITQ